jgi:3-oxoacyl-[acyl-carrier protein] reductase
MAEQGADIAVCDIDLENARSVAREVEKLDRQSEAIRADVSSENEVEEMVQQVLQRFGRINILVNNAGVVSTGPVTEITMEVWRRTVAINLTGVFLCTRAVFPGMKAQSDGRIVNIASAAGKRGGGMHGSSCYAATKGGVIAFTKAIAREGGPYKVRVNAIAPALIETEMIGSLPQERLEKLLETIPMRRVGKAEEVAAAACFLASDAASFMTGEIMDVDGGLIMD